MNKVAYTKALIESYYRIIQSEEEAKLAAQQATKERENK